jgi:tetratricopeptide (TPR) repeat protein
MGFPFLETIKISNDGVELKKLAQKLEQDPENAETRQKFEGLLLAMDSRPYRQPANLFELAEAHAVAGDTGTALRYVDMTLDADPGFEPARVLKLELSTEAAPRETPEHPHSDLGQLIERVRVSSRDMAAREELHARLEELESEEKQETETLYLMVEGWDALEEVERARHSLQLLREKDPEHPDIPRLMRRLRFTR